MAGVSSGRVRQSKKKPRALTRRRMRDSGRRENCVWWRVGYLLPEILPPTGRASSGDLDEVFMHSSWGHRKKLPASRCSNGGYGS